VLVFEFHYHPRGNSGAILYCNNIHYSEYAPVVGVFSWLSK